MITKLTVATLAVLALAVPARAGSLIVTPALRPPPGGELQCLVANASPKKTVECSVKIYDYDGTAIVDTQSSLAPNTNLSYPSNAVTQGHCVAEVLHGGKKNLRVSLQMLDAADNVVAAVAGH